MKVVLQRDIMLEGKVLVRGEEIEVSQERAKELKRLGVIEKQTSDEQPKSAPSKAKAKKD
ncbi:DUF7210 family protein [Dietzia sp. MNB45]|uniref:DUF7210 family protein n=1 Tax=Dietzia sp. MNB45 TaxID=3238800 RepID=UPI003F7E636A